MRFPGSLAGSLPGGALHTTDNATGLRRSAGPTDDEVEQFIAGATCELEEDSGAAAGLADQVGVLARAMAARSEPDRSGSILAPSIASLTSRGSERAGAEVDVESGRASLAVRASGAPGSVLAIRVRCKIGTFTTQSPPVYSFIRRVRPFLLRRPR